jgi:hypothetical protein
MPTVLLRERPGRLRFGVVNPAMADTSTGTTME